MDCVPLPGEPGSQALGLERQACGAAGGLGGHLVPRPASESSSADARPSLHPPEHGRGRHYSPL